MGTLRTALIMTTAIGALTIAACNKSKDGTPISRLNPKAAMFAAGQCGNGPSKEMIDVTKLSEETLTEKSSCPKGVDFSQFDSGFSESSFDKMVDPTQAGSWQLSETDVSVTVTDNSSNVTNQLNASATETDGKTLTVGQAPENIGEVSCYSLNDDSGNDSDPAKLPTTNKLPAPSASPAASQSLDIAAATRSAPQSAPQTAPRTGGKRQQTANCNQKDGHVPATLMTTLQKGVSNPYRISRQDGSFDTIREDFWSANTASPNSYKTGSILFLAKSQPNRNWPAKITGYGQMLESADSSNPISYKVASNGTEFEVLMSRSKNYTFKTFNYTVVVVSKLLYKAVATEVAPSPSSTPAATLPVPAQTPAATLPPATTSTPAATLPAPAQTPAATLPPATTSTPAATLPAPAQTPAAQLQPADSGD